MAENYIDPSLKALTKLRDILTPHGIQLMNVLNVGSAPIVSLRKYGYDGEVSPPTLTVEVAIPDDDGQASSSSVRKSE
jgi:hypothetical protein